MEIVIIIVSVLLGLATKSTGAKIVLFVIAIGAFIVRRKRKNGSKAAPDVRRDLAVSLPPREVPPYKRITVNTFLKNPPDEYVAFDLETTGLSPRTDRIIEIGAVYVDHGQVISRFSQLINPRMYIPAAASEVNHITDDMVRKCPTIDRALPEFCAFVGNAKILAAHNAKFDADFLMAAAQACGISLDVKFFDTLALSRAAWPDLKNHKLGTLAIKIKHPIGQAHRAADDAAVLPDLIETATKAIRRAELKRAKEENTSNS